MKNHASFVPDVFYRQKPDVFWMAGGFSNKEPKVLNIPFFNANIFRNIQRDSQFKKCMELLSFEIEEEYGS